MTAHDPAIAVNETEVAPGIFARDLHFKISANAERHWFGGDQMRTAVMDAFAICLPEGERYFIRSLKRFAKNMNDEGLLAEIRGYAAQEAFHTREHEDYNRALSDLGYDVPRLERRTRDILAESPIDTPEWNLAVTCAIEHVTASFSIAVLRDGEMLLQDAAPAYRRLWTWHALEELEHAAVALDVYASATASMSSWKRYVIRVTAMVVVMTLLNYLMVRNIASMARSDGLSRGPRLWVRYLDVMWRKPGFMRLGFRSFMRYFSPRFDPRKMIDPALIERGRALLKADMGEVSP